MLCHNMFRVAMRGHCTSPQPPGNGIRGTDDVVV